MVAALSKAADAVENGLLVVGHLHRLLALPPALELGHAPPHAGQQQHVPGPQLRLQVVRPEPDASLLPQLPVRQPEVLVTASHMVTACVFTK